MQTTRLIAATALSLFALVPVLFAETRRPPEIPTVRVPLENFWVETISRDEAIRRLNGRQLPDSERKRIQAAIPAVTQNYLVFRDGVFKEYVTFGNGPSELVLMLPAQKTANGYDVIVTLYDSERTKSGHVRHVRGIEVHRFTERGATLFENDAPRPSFRRSTGTAELQVNTALLFSPVAIPIGICCGACEWVHSALDIHCADWACCLGRCYDLL
jgi:hypothetical protein